MTGCVVGIDVGGLAKGFHAVALEGRHVLHCVQSGSPAEIARWCRVHNAQAIGVDAPCRWRNGRARAAERALAREKIPCFVTPTRKAAAATPFYRWMLNGAALYRALVPHFPLFEGGTLQGAQCFETYPHAIACALGRNVARSTKTSYRRNVIERAGIEATLLTNADYIDAALCALTARFVQTGSFTAYGERSSGLILVPRLS